MTRLPFQLLPLAATALLAAASVAQASSHREAWFITSARRVDATDFYVFRSDESGRDGYVALLADYQALRVPYGGPDHFSMDPDALYEIHVDNNGAARDDLAF